MSYFKRIDQVLGYAEYSLSRAASRLRGLMAHPKLFFMHIPKTGGTSVKSAIYNERKAWYDCHVDAGKTRRAIKENTKNTNREKYFRELFKLRQSMAVRRLKANKPVVTGHIPVPGYFLSKFSKYKFFTVVRNPVDRWISDYRFSYEIDGLSTFFGGKNPDHPAEGIKLALESECGAPQRNIYANYFSGYGLVNDTSVQEREKSN